MKNIHFQYSKDDVHSTLHTSIHFTGLGHIKIKIPKINFTNFAKKKKFSFEK